MKRVKFIKRTGHDKCVNKCKKSAIIHTGKGPETLEAGQIPSNDSRLRTKIIIVKRQLTVRNDTIPVKRTVQCAKKSNSRKKAVDCAQR